MSNLLYQPAFTFTPLTVRRPDNYRENNFYSYFIMVIQHKQLQGKGMFYVGQDGAILAEMVYTMAPNKMIIEHTEVDDSLSGKGVGKQLVQTAVEYARNHNIKIVPLCPFAKSVLDKMEEWQDVVA